MSKEIYLAQTPDEQSLFAYQIAEDGNQSSYLINKFYARTIDLLLAETGVDDAGARILASLYDKGVIMRDDAPWVIDGLPAELGSDLLKAVYLNELEGKASSQTTNLLMKIQDKLPVDDIYLLTSGGLLAEDTDTDGSPFVEGFDLDEINRSCLGFSRAHWEWSARDIDGVREIASTLGLDMAAGVKELVWEAGEGGAKSPRLLSTRSHIALGYLATVPTGEKGSSSASEDFIHIATVLSPEHPARYEVVRYAPEPS